MTITTLVLALLTFSMSSSQDTTLPTTLRPVPFEAVRIHDSFFRPRTLTNHRVTLAANLDQCEKTGRIANFGGAAFYTRAPPKSPGGSAHHPSTERTSWGSAA